MHRYATSFAPNSHGWDSTAVIQSSLPAHLQAEGHLLACEYHHLMEQLPWDSRAEPPSLHFVRSNFDRQPHPTLPSQLPDVSDLFGHLAPPAPKTYTASCHLQRRHKKEFTICFDTGCSMSSTFSLQDFEAAPVKGRFGQLCTINQTIPIEAAGIICWHVLDARRNPATI